jgi:hypothetical protein
MMTPQQFIESYLHEKAEVYARANTQLEPLYKRYFDGPMLQRYGDFLLSDRQVVDEVSQSSASAMVITHMRFKSADLRLRWRYHLSAVGENWKIIRKDRQCVVCHGSGRLGTTACSKCAGEGWHDSATDVS